jgi:hypothetical protein
MYNENKLKIIRAQNKGDKKMIKFEVGKVYGTDANVYEVIKKTAKTITYHEIAHYGRSNEKRYEQKRTKLLNWDTREVFLANGRHTIEATEPAEI